jgi:hypothetical protein
MAKLFGDDWPVSSRPAISQQIRSYPTDGAAGRFSISPTP